MEESDKVRGRYFQTIAREFFSRRGAPFFLSAKDVALVAGWEKMGIPLRVVLEGIERSFAPGGGRPTARGKVRSLGFCEPEVLRSFARHRERGVGRARKVNSRNEKAARLRADVQKFLLCLPAEVDCLRPLFEQAEEILSLPAVNEEELESLEAEVEERLFHLSAPALRGRLEREIRAESRGMRDEEAEGFARAKLIRYHRDRYRIPHLSLFYY